MAYETKLLKGQCVVHPDPTQLMLYTQDWLKNVSQSSCHVWNILTILQNYNYTLKGGEKKSSLNVKVNIYI